MKRRVKGRERKFLVFGMKFWGKKEKRKEKLSIGRKVSIVILLVIVCEES